ncbi:chemotaxis protein [Psychrobium sp. 1_MG-2023]|uniref:chemotaxis protein n=1 Tax=Psychrobium sp. 1_MG-2023 TaxID=3062624 RepID=UPI000C32270A|nr:chemotaxis protein [Psychrobium sp. 1_MG-2023]MDP2559875.1 chemotaxis protein [Psychrobium sp. 1_MG-2023]PKF59024.1 chemotaxis protein CheW [Alteromonadales bacterium alter-6D02]
MAGVLDSVNQRTQLVGQNRLELLLFKLNGRQRYGINVFKVKEVLQCPKLTSLPNLAREVRGIAHIRGETISVIDLSLATGGAAIDDLTNRFIIITEYNRSIQGFLVDSVERIINLNWEQIMPPPEGAGDKNYLTAVTEVDNDMVGILDVEKILMEVAPTNEEMTDEVLQEAKEIIADSEKMLMIADDSTVALNQVKRALTPLGLEIMQAKNGREALEQLIALSETCERSVTEKLGLLISDIEMPEMDGYTLTAEIRTMEKLKDLRVILHTSLSGVFNQAMVDNVGADDFIAKFNPDDLAAAVERNINILHSQPAREISSDK